MASTFSYYTAYVGNGEFTFTAPENNVYQFFAWGRSGNGVTGGGASTTAYPSGGPGGAGGGSGGFSASQIYLNQGETVSVSISDSITTITRAGVYMQATAGGDAVRNNEYVKEQPGGDGGSASGGNVANLPGFQGGAGGRGQQDSSWPRGTDGKQGGNSGALGGTGSWCGGGGGGARAPGSDFCRYVATDMHIYRGGSKPEWPVSYNGYEHATVPPPVVAGPSIVVYGGGSGGAGAYRGAGSTHETNPNTIPSGVPGTGSPGVVIIEKQDNRPPTDPSGLTYTGDVKAGSQITLTTGGSVDPDGDAIQYVFEYRVDTGAYVQAGITAALSIPVTVPTSGTLYQARVKAVDSAGLESGYYTGAAVAIKYNDPPVIHDGIAGNDLGDLTAQGLTYSYTVTDDKDSQVGVQLWVDSELAASLTVPVGVAQTFVLDTAHWQRLLNGSHTLSVVATDSEQASTTRVLTFQRWQRVIEFTLAGPKATGSRARRIAVQLGSYRPEGSQLTVLATNNALDAAPTWENITQAVENNRVHIFENQGRTAADWAINIHVILERGVAVGDCFISGLALGYETDGGAAATVAANEALLDILLTDILPQLTGGENL